MVTVTEESVGAYIDRLMKRAGVSYAMLSEQIRAKGESLGLKNPKVHANTIRDIVDGKQSPKPHTLQKIASVLKGADFETMMRLAGYLPGSSTEVTAFAPDVQEVALRLSALSAKRRSRLLPLIEGMVDVLEGDEEEEQEVDRSPIDA